MKRQTPFEKWWSSHRQYPAPANAYALDALARKCFNAGRRSKRK